ncbi:MAG: hypothetical protein PHW65_04595 [Dehalococcoidales bacterium]|nr:hypothetical protein [Dehalococcoidales bacterium]
MSTCPYGVQTSFEPRQCPCEQRITEAEEGIVDQKKQLKEVREMIRSPQITVALIAAFSGIFCGFMGFVGVVFGPVVKAWLGL